MAKELEQELGKREPLDRLVSQKGVGGRGQGTGGRGCRWSPSNVECVELVLSYPVRHSLALWSPFMQHRYVCSLACSFLYTEC